MCTVHTQPASFPDLHSSFCHVLGMRLVDNNSCKIRISSYPGAEEGRCLDKKLTLDLHLMDPTFGYLSSQEAARREQANLQSDLEKVSSSYLCDVLLSCAPPPSCSSWLFPAQWIDKAKKKQDRSEHWLLDLVVDIVLDHFSLLLSTLLLFSPLLFPYLPSFLLPPSLLCTYQSGSFAGGEGTLLSWE